ncbi:uncharacterized protein GGS25DRAFT_26600 [Hypoxylon fragiforme]|uniref:uncharacterized protein n=1 Tax=Hypoxylon fragiforme TaxID=63214 RepID=UPI0020C73D43|nr:uncharacterized protein GGS25DRAFT_26600 [Hypoxylon fragiforme]KAI2613942.1 hypothetical protein GGS25DRAFT_26600 [Hypoxylon fragiforme]
MPMVKWNISDKCVELAPNIKECDKTIHISFSPRGTLETNNESTQNVMFFIKKTGYLKQWIVNSNNKIHDALWAEDIDLWGYPLTTHEAEPRRRRRKD